MGTNTIATPLYTYRHAITHELDGLLAGEQDWLASLETMITMLDTGQYQKMAYQAHHTAETRYVWYHQKELLRTVFA